MSYFDSGGNHQVVVRPKIPIQEKIVEFGQILTYTCINYPIFVIV